jgi:hypothetical protein
VGCVLLALAVGVAAACCIVWDPLDLFGYTDRNYNFDSTRAKLHTIDTALDYYNKQHAEYPISLHVLVERDGAVPALLDSDTIQDGWCREFNYERDKRDPKSGRPRVWSWGSHPDDPGSVISNW